MKGKILVVDDDPQILDVLDIRLASLGLEVTTTGNPGHAVEIAASKRMAAAISAWVPRMACCSRRPSTAINPTCRSSS